MVCRTKSIFPTFLYIIHTSRQLLLLISFSQVPPKHSASCVTLLITNRIMKMQVVKLNSKSTYDKYKYSFISTLMLRLVLHLSLSSILVKWNLRGFEQRKAIYQGSQIRCERVFHCPVLIGHIQQHKRSIKTITITVKDYIRSNCKISLLNKQRWEATVIYREAVQNYGGVH